MRQSSTLNINISNVHSQNSENPDILYRMVEGFGTKQNKKTQKFTDRFRTTSVLKVYFFLIMNESPNIGIPLNVYTRVDWIVLMNCYQRESWILFKTPLRDSLMKLVITNFHH